MLHCNSFRRFFVLLSASVLAVSLAGCATLPRTGPTGGRVVNAAQDGQFELVTVRTLGDVPQGEEIPAFTELPEVAPQSAERLRPGDTLTVMIYEVGVRLFSSGPPPEGAAGFDPAARAERIGPVEVDTAGLISLPYIGTVLAHGLTARQLEREIEGRLRGKSEFPQVVVQRSSAQGSAAFVAGDVMQPGRVPLSSASERLLDAIALTGGARGDTGNLILRIMRSGRVSEGPFERVRYDNIGGLMLEPGDRIELFRLQRHYTVLGMVNRTNRFDLPLRPYSLAEALAQAGGPIDALANPAAVFVFRYRTGPDGAEPAPVVYHVNMLEPASYLLAQRFALAHDDVIYIAGAQANEPTKILQLIGQIFAPILTARAVTQ
jgi:polysaccharide biosynthesis/export protein